MVFTLAPTTTYSAAGTTLAGTGIKVVTGKLSLLIFLPLVMATRTVIGELKETLYFICSAQFWRMALLWTVSILVSYIYLFSQKLFSCKKNSYPRVPPRIGVNRPICIITGATSGLGKAAAYSLSKEGFYVVLAGRSSQLLLETIGGIKKQNKDAHLKSFEIDLSSFYSILKFKDSLEKWLSDSNMHLSIQLLINNAGILATSPRLTADGYDEMVGTNYVGTFSLTKLLLPLLKNSTVGSRIVNVTSFTHRNVFGMQSDKETVSGRCFSRSKQYPCAHIYEYSKLCLLLFSYELHRQLRSMDQTSLVSVNAADPGVVETNIMREIPTCLTRVAFIALKLLGLLQSPENGVGSVLDAALAPPEISGLYFFGGKGRTVKSSALSHNAKLQEKLWTSSCDLFLESRLASLSAS